MKKLNIFVLGIALLFIFTTCDMQLKTRDQQGTILINLGGSNARSAFPWPTDDDDVLDDLSFEITITNGKETFSPALDEDKTASLSVAQGTWKITINAFIEEDGHDTPFLYATGTTTVNVIAGETTDAEIEMLQNFWYRVTFESDGDSPVPEQIIRDGEKVTEPADPTKGGSIFSHWYYLNDSETEVEWNFDSIVSENIYLRAKWEPVYTPYIITENGGNFTATLNGFTETNSAIQTVINAIRADADGAECAIQFGNGDTLDIGTSGIKFENTGDNWGKVTLLGSLTSSANPLITIELDITVDSKGSIEATGDAGMGTFSNNGGTLIVSDGLVRGTTPINNGIPGIICKVIISGGRVEATGDGGNAIYSTQYGQITISGNAMVTSSNTKSVGEGTILLFTNSTLEIDGGTVQNTSTGNAIYNAHEGDVKINKGTVSASSGRAIVNDGGTLYINGGKIEATALGGIAILNLSGTVNINDGDVIGSSTATAIRNQSSNTINIDGGNVESAGNYTIFNQDNGTINIISGTVINKATSGNPNTIHNQGAGSINISGGTVEAIGNMGIAVRLFGTGKLTVSGDAFITSANPNTDSGTITVELVSSVSLEKLVITGGIVENTAKGNAIYNDNNYPITISGGTVRTESPGVAIYDDDVPSDLEHNISDDAVIIP